MYRQNGGAAYSQSDIVSGKKTLANGAVAGYVMKDGKKVWRIVSGASPQYLDSIRQPGAPRKALSQKAAQRAFNKYWKTRVASAGPNKNQARAYKAAWARDINYGRPSGLRTTTAYKRNPGRLEYQGVDFGAKRYPAATGARLAALQRGQAALARKRGM